MIRHFFVLSRPYRCIMVSNTVSCFPSSACGDHTSVPNILSLWSIGVGDNSGTQQHGHGYVLLPMGSVFMWLEGSCSSSQRRCISATKRTFQFAFKTWLFSSSAF